MKSIDKIAVIVVTYNRKKLLERCLNALFEQTVPVWKICIVDNASTDGSEVMVKFFQENYPEQIVYIQLKENTGGAGGFNKGFRWAKQYGGWNWLLVMDDDAAPAPDYIEKLLVRAKQFPQVRSFIGTEYVGYTDRIAYGGRRVIDKESTVRTVVVPGEFYNKDYFYVDTAVFVGLMIHHSVVEKAGYPDASFFIYYDDTDYCLKIREYTKIMHVTDARIVHRENYEQNVVIEGQKLWRMFYLYRNELVIKKRYIKRWYIRYGWILKNYMIKIAEIWKAGDQRWKKFRLISRATWDVLNNHLGKAAYVDEE